MKYISSNKIFNKYKKLVFILILFALFFIPISAHAVTRKAEFVGANSFKTKISRVLQEYYTGYNNMKGFVRSDTAPDTSNMQEYNIISTSDSDDPIYIWADSSFIVYWWTANEHPVMPNPSKMFSDATSITRIDLSTVTTTGATDMSSMFSKCNQLVDLDISNFDTSSVTNMSAMFYDCNKLTNLDLSHFDTRNVESFHNMFYNCSSLTDLNISSFNTEKAIYLSSMFYNCTSLTELNLSHFYTPEVTDMSNMFRNCISLTSLNISNFNTSKVKNMSRMFNGIKVTELNLSHFNTENVTNMSGMFAGMNKIINLDISSFNTSKVTDMSYMFSSTSIPEINIKHFDTSKVTTMLEMFRSSEIDEVDLSDFDTSSLTNMNYMFYESKIARINLANWNNKALKSMERAFSNCINLTELNLTNFRTDSVTNMTSIFSGITSLTELDLSSFNTSNITDMSYMFYNCKSLTSLDLSNFDTRKVTKMQSMFYGCSSLISLNVSNFKIYNVTDMGLYEMFRDCSSLEELDLHSFDISYAKYTSNMFWGMKKLKTLDLSNFNMSNIQNANGMFYGCSDLETIYVGQMFNIDNINTSNKLFSENNKLVGQSGTTFDSSHVDKLYARIDDPENGNPGYFTYKEYKPKVYYPDGTYEEVELNSIFTFPDTYERENEDKSIVTLDSNYENGEVKNSYVQVQYTFNNWTVNDDTYEPNETKVITFDTYLEANYVETIAGADLSPARRSGYKFLGWYTDPENGELVESYNGEEDITLYAHWGDAQVAYLIEGSTINDKFDKTNTTEFRRATLEEYNAATLTDDNIISTNDSPNVVYMWNTTIDSKVVTLYYTEADFMYMNSDSSHMFQGLSNITELDLGDFITSNVTDMSYMFGYIGVTSLDLSTFDTSNVTKMNEMFFNSSNLQELNVSSFDVSKVTTMVGMFDNCPSLQELDLSSFDTRKVSLMGSMFAYCSKLTTIYVSNKWSTSGLNHNANQSTMFAGDIRIMGYLGSKYDFYWHGDEKARIDGGPSNEGYLTDISHKGETHTVTFPDNSVRTYNHNSIVYLDTNETSLGEYTSGEITFKYHNGNIDTTSNQVFEMVGDGFTCDDKHYNNNGEIRVNSDKVIEYAYKPVITNSVFPEDPEKDGYIFMGWFTEEEGGEKYTEYTGDEPIVLHAQYGLPISYLMSGSDINDKINYLTDDSSINEFRRGTIEEYNQAKDSFDDNYNIISTDESPLPTYMWYDGENILYYSEAESIYMNADSSNMFSYTYASSIDVTEFDTSNVTDMSYMFSSGEMTELDLSHFNTSNVTNMTGMFDGCSSLQTIYVSNSWSTESLEDGNGQYMFNYDENLVGSSGTTYDENHIDQEYARPDEGVDNPGYLTLVTFYNVTYPNSSTRSYKDGTVINLGENDSPAIIVTAGTITFKYHDDETEDTTLTKITTKTPNGFIVNDIHIDNNEDITINEDKVIEYDYDETAVDNIFPVASKEGYEFIGWYTEETGGEKIEEYNGNEPITLHARYMAEFSKLKAGDEINSKIFWSASGSFRKATLEEYNSVKDTLTDNDIISIEGTKPTYLWQTGENVLYYSEAETIYMNEDASSIFDSKSLSSIDLSGIDFSMTTNMNSIFRASDAATITLGNINTSNITNMGSMFGQMPRLTSIDNLSFDTHNVTDMSYMFYDSHSLTELDLSDFDTSSVEDMEYMFAGCNSLTSLNISSFETSQVTDMYSMFKYDSALTEINVSNFVTSNVESFSSMFEGCTSLSSIDVTNFDTQKANYLDGMFKDCSLLTTLDLSSFDTQNVMSISEMFSGDTSLETIYVSDAWSTNSIADWGRYDVFSYDENLVGGAGTVFDEEHTNYEYARIDGGVDNPGYLTLKVDQVLPTYFDFDADDIKMVVGQVHQIEVTFTPEGATDTLTYTGYDDTKISVVDGLITGLSEGTTTITVGTENTDIEKTINVTVVNNVLTSDIYEVRDVEHEDLTTDRIVIGAEDGTLISEFKDNMLNPNEYIKIYDKDGNEVEDSEIVRTGLTIKLEYNGIVLDEASMVVRGDVDGDGFINVSDYISVLNHALSLEEIDNYIKFAAGDVEEDDMLNVSDYIKIMDYALRNIDSIND